jgi:hypothetical protein
MQNQWVRKNPNPKKQFDGKKEKEIFTEAQQEFQKEDTMLTSQQNKEALEYDMTPSLDHTNIIQLKEQVSTLKDFLQSCIKMLGDPSSIKVLQNILEKCSGEME